MFDFLQINDYKFTNSKKQMLIKQKKTRKYLQNQLPVLRNAFDTSFVVDSLEWDFKVHTHSIDKIIIFLQSLARKHQLQLYLFAFREFKNSQLSKNYFIDQKCFYLFCEKKGVNKKPLIKAKTCSLDLFYSGCHFCLLGGLNQKNFFYV